MSLMDDPRDPDGDNAVPTSDILWKMQEFVKGFTFRDISIKSHCHGYRVTLSHDLHEVVTEVEDSVEKAFAKCLKSFPKAIKNVHTREIQRLDVKIREIEQELQRTKEQRKELVKTNL